MKSKELIKIIQIIMQNNYKAALIKTFLNKKELNDQVRALINYLKKS